MNSNMKRIFIIILLLSCCNILLYSQKIELDSVYKVLYDFLWEEREDFRDLLIVSSTETFRDKIVINDISDSTTFNSGIDSNKEIAVYEFYVRGEGHPVSYILVKEFEEFRIYRNEDITRVIEFLLYLKKQYPEFITDIQFIDLIQKLVGNATGIFLGIKLKHGVSYFGYWENVKKIQNVR